MSFRTHPSYTADTQSNITSQVPDSENGVMCYAELQNSYWVLNKSSAMPLGPRVIATKSGVGRWLRTSGLPGSTASFVFVANGDLGLFPTDLAAPSGDGGDSFFDCPRQILFDCAISGFTMSQRSDGDSGSTTVEVYRYRAATFFLLATLTIASGSPLQITVAAPPPAPDDLLQSGDIVMCKFTSVQDSSATNVPQDVCVTMETD